METALQRKLEQEMGFQCDVSPIFTMLYHLPLENGLIEHEFDHVWFGIWKGEPVPNPKEVQNWRWATSEEIYTELVQSPQTFTPWFHILFPRVIAEMEGYLVR